MGGAAASTRSAGDRRAIGGRRRVRFRMAQPHARASGTAYGNDFLYSGSRGAVSRSRRRSSARDARGSGQALRPLATAAAKDMNLTLAEQQPEEVEKRLRRSIAAARQFLWTDGTSIQAIAGYA